MVETRNRRATLSEEEKNQRLEEAKELLEESKNETNAEGTQLNDAIKKFEELQASLKNPTKTEENDRDMKLIVYSLQIEAQDLLYQKIDEVEQKYHCLKLKVTLSMKYIKLAPNDDLSAMLIEDGAVEVVNLELSIREKSINDRIKALEAVLKEIQPTHLNLYVLLTYKVAKLYSKACNNHDESIMQGLGLANGMVMKARDHLKKSKSKGGDEHPKADKLDELENSLTTSSQTFVSRKLVLQSEEKMIEAMALPDGDSKTTLVLGAIDDA